MNHFISKIHLWLGLITAPIVFFICLTGTVIVFSDEIMELSAGDARYVAQVEENRLPAEQLITIIKNKFPNRRMPAYLVSYKDPKRSVRFNTYDPEKGLRMVYIDPYTGSILKDDSTIYFFYITAHLHNSFMLHKTGEWIVDSCVVLFVISMLSGLLLWWPGIWDKKNRKASFSIKWNAPFRRVNYDLHKVLGFYGLGVSLLLAFTGLIIAFQPLNKLTKDVFGGDSSRNVLKELAKADSTQTAVPLNTVIQKTFASLPDKKEIQVYTYKLDASGCYILNAAKRIGLKSAQSNEFLVFNKYTGNEITLSPEVLQNENIKNMYWVLHMGNWMGLLGKIITFLGGLISTTLPVTGFYIWWQKFRQKKANRMLFRKTQ